MTRRTATLVQWVVLASVLAAPWAALLASGREWLYVVG